MGKYHSKKVCYDGIWFDSTTEGDYYLVLKEKVKNGEISDLRLQVPYVVIPAVYVETVKHLKTKDKIERRCAQRETKYFADFVYVDNKSGETVVVDVKSEATIKKESYILKKKLMLAYHGIKITEVLWQTRRKPQTRKPRVARSKAGRSRRRQEQAI